MKRINLFLLGLLALSCNSIKNEAQSILFQKKDITKESQHKKGIVLIADGTYSGSQYYVVPQLTVEFTSFIISKLRCNGGGMLWVTYIDNLSQDNECLSLEIPTPLNVSSNPPKVNETGYVKHKKVKKDWQNRHDKLLRDSLKEVETFNQLQTQFIEKLYFILQNKVYVQSNRNKWSDVNGSVSSAQIILKQALNSKLIDRAFIVGFSDFEDDAKKSAYTPVTDIQIFNIISQPGKSRNSIKGSIEIVSENELTKNLKL